MVILLNYLPWIAVAVAFAVGYRMHKSGKLTFSKGVIIAAVTVLVIGILQAATPSYMPKPEVKRLPNPTFEQRDAEVEDRLKKPELSTEERQQRFDEKFDAVKQATEK